LSPDRSRRLEPRRLLAGARTRVLLAFVVLLALSTVASTFALRQILLARAGERVEQALVQEVDEFRQLVRHGINPRTGEPFGGNVKALFDVFLQRNTPGEGEAIFTFLDGRPYTSTEEPSRPLRDRVLEVGAASRDDRGEVETPEGTVRYLAVPVEVGPRQRGEFVVAVNLGHERAEVREAVQVAAGVSLAVLLIASALAWVIAGRVLAPLRTLRTTAQAITETDLTQRLEVHGNDEIAELGRTFNAMLDRLEAAFASQKALVSDAGHELRTPITIVRGHLELLGDDPAEREETIALVTDELDRMARFVDDLLLLAKAEQSDFLHLGPLDLDVLTDELYAKAQALADRDWRLVGSGAGRLTADRQRLTQAVMQLAQNAVQHTEPGDRIALGSVLAGQTARLWVADSGPGVPPDERERIFDRFHRGGDGRRRSDGAGLGLSIVRAIAEAHGGRVELDSREGAGATFTLVLPTEPPREDGTP
jgi:two-component system, OmpR family, sensor kinase